jgi:putative ABC transport system permease protein
VTTARVRRFVLRLRAFIRPGHADAELAREIAAHLQLLEDDFAAKGMSPADARLAARKAFGGVDQARARQRDARSFRWLDESWLDARLGVRMLLKYPGLAIIGGLGMAVAIAIGATFFTITYSFAAPELPLEDADRVIALQNWDADALTRESRSLHDFVAWRDELRSVVELSAAQTVTRNLQVTGRVPEPIDVAEMTASGFRVARVAPLMGRTLVPDDERPGSAPVVVIGHDVWRDRFAADPSILGQTLRLGGTVHTVVGVMPAGFAFPVNQHLWVPLIADLADYERRQGPMLQLFGRLAPGVTREQAQAELAALGQRAAADFPDTHQHLRPRVLMFTSLYTVISTEGAAHTELLLLQVFVTLILIVVCANVALLVYARTATRMGEITLRTALGASRGRIIGQLFIEALVLSALAAALGLALARIALAELYQLLAMVGGVPFWIQPGLSRGAVFYAMALAVVAAVICGIIPAVKATGRSMQPALRTLGGGGGAPLGRTWTTLIGVQIAIAVAILPEPIFTTADWIKAGFATPGFAAEKMLTAQLDLERESPPSGKAQAHHERYARRFGGGLSEVLRQLDAETSVALSTFASAVPGQEPTVRIEIEGDATVEPGLRVRRLQVGPRFFEAFDAAILAGRGFHPGDADSPDTRAGGTVIVNRAFAEHVIGEGPVVGRHLRYRAPAPAPDQGEPPRWYEIVGVVGDFPSSQMEEAPTASARVYHYAAPEDVQPAWVVVRTMGPPPSTLADRIREVAAGIDPALHVTEALPLDEFYNREQSLMRAGAIGVTLVMVSVLALSAAGVYALMSFTVNRRRREISIRAALGANPRRLLSGSLAAALRQVVFGIAAGLAVAVLLEYLSGGSVMDGHGLIVLPSVAALMLIVGLLAALGPARRGLRIDPVEALREQ